MLIKTQDFINLFKPKIRPPNENKQQSYDGFRCRHTA